MTEILEPPSSAEERSTHARLLSASAALFAERGYSGTSMADIAERVGVRKASLYNYYDSKEALLMDLLQRGLDDWLAACLPALEGEGDHGERLWRHFRATVRLTVEEPELVAIFRIAANQIGGELGERAQELATSQRQRHRESLSRFFAEAVDAGAVAPADPEDLSYVFRMFSNGVLTGHLGACDVDERLGEERLERVWQLFWSGLGSGEGRREGGNP